MSNLSVFVDESGDLGETSRFYLISLILFDHQAEMAETIEEYEQAIRDKSLRNLPMHLGPPMNGHDDFEYLDIETRKKALATFQVFIEHSPFLYQVFAYQKKWFSSQDSQVVQRLKRDLATFLLDNLVFFQKYNTVTIHYDNGQKEIASALRDTFRYALSKASVQFRKDSPRNNRLLQVADYVCGLELIALKYDMKIQTPTDEAFFGGSSSFRKNYLKKVRRKRLN